MQMQEFGEYYPVVEYSDQSRFWYVTVLNF